MAIRLSVALVFCLAGVTGSHAASLDDALAKWSAPEVTERINTGIEQNRKGDVVVTVLGADGKPVPGATVSAVQTSHAFLFGANLFVLGQLKTPELNAKFEKAFTGIFNFASLPFYWKDLEPEPGALRFTEDAPYVWRRPPPDVLLEWCRANKITPKGHPLLWHAINPDWMPKEPDALRAAYVKRFTEIAERYGDAIPIWDGVNESLVCSKEYPLYSADLEYVPWAFDEQHKVFPDATLIMINEVTTVSHVPADTNRYLAQVKSLLAQGCDIEGIGFQFHYFSRDAFDSGFLTKPDTAPQTLLDTYDAFGDLDLPLYITEITIPGAGPDGPEIQAQFVEHLYRLWFSVEQMAGITWWNLVDNTAYGNEGIALAGLVDDNIAPKPAYAALDKLINDEWKTQFTGTTDAAGKCMFRGFAGNYVVEAVRSDGTKFQGSIAVEPRAENALSLGD